MNTRSRTGATVRRLALGASSAALLALTACSGDAATEAAPAPAPSTSAAAGTSAAQPSASTGGAAATSASPTSSSSAGTGAQPEWANPVTTPGTSIARINAGDLTVEVFQVGTAAATDTGSFADPTTSQPLIAVGDPLVFVNYVVTNNGAPVDLSASLVTIAATYDNWPWLQGMDGLSDRDLFTAQGVNADGLAAGAFRDPSIYTFGTGQTYSFGESFEYQAGGAISFDVSYTPVDATGDLLHDQRVEGTGSGVTA